MIGFSIKLPGLVLLVLIVTYGCGVQKFSDIPGASHNFPHEMKAIEDAFWWKCRFKIAWPEGERPKGAVDLLLAHAVVAPVLSQYGDNIPYWRFHRRAARDAAGHQFSFLFYGTPRTASSVFDAVETSGVLHRAVTAGIVEKVILDDPATPERSGIGDTSDPNWSPEIQRRWPAFIMGVSSFWLGLIIEVQPQSPESTDDIRQLLSAYRQADAVITKKWRNEGQHALLHHLNAVFGYEPMLIRKALSF